MSASGSGARSGRTTAPTATRGTTCRMITRGPGPTGGGRTAWPISGSPGGKGVMMGAERERIAGFGPLEDGLLEAGEWYRWGPYVSERQWGTVREDYSADGNAWDYLPHDHARSRAYRWGEDGLADLGFARRQRSNDGRRA